MNKCSTNDNVAFPRLKTLTVNLCRTPVAETAVAWMSSLYDAHEEHDVRIRRNAYRRNPRNYRPSLHRLQPFPFSHPLYLHPNRRNDVTNVQTGGRERHVRYSRWPLKFDSRREGNGQQQRQRSFEAFERGRASSARGTHKPRLS